MKKAILAVLVAAFGYNCAMAQAAQPARNPREANAKQEPVVNTRPKDGVSSPTNKKPVSKPYATNKRVVAKQANVIKTREVKAAPAPRPVDVIRYHHDGDHKKGHHHHGKGHAYGHDKHDENKPVCNKPIQRPIQQPLPQPQRPQPQGPRNGIKR